MSGFFVVWIKKLIYFFFFVFGFGRLVIFFLKILDVRLIDLLSVGWVWIVNVMFLVLVFILIVRLILLSILFVLVFIIVLLIMWFVFFLKIILVILLVVLDVIVWFEVVYGNVVVL